MIKPEQITASFYQVIKDKPELFQGEAFHDLPYLEIALDRAEYELEGEQLEFVADAIIDFCDHNPEVDQAVRQELEENPDQVVTEEVLPALTETVDSLLEQEEKAHVTYEGKLQPESSL